ATPVVIAAAATGPTVKSSPIPATNPATSAAPAVVATVAAVATATPAAKATTAATSPAPAAIVPPVAPKPAAPVAPVVIPKCKWKAYDGPGGRKYYSDGKASLWDKPKELKDYEAAVAAAA
ncbi:unnamed protein product, partial [Ectocarpus sp. 6 AP-2014]